MTLIDGFMNLSERRGREGVGSFCFQASLEAGRLGIGLADFRFSARGGLAGRSRPEGFGPRTLFDNFIGRKRDVDGGVLAGLFCCETGKSEETS